jgi:hypothetical protein
MRVVRIVAAAFVLSASTLSAQTAAAPPEWTEFVERTDRFSINFPGRPTIRETIYPPQRGQPVLARIYTVNDGPRRYSVTVVNLATIKEPSDIKGSVAWEAWNFRKRGGEITYDAYAQVDRIEGHQLHITNSDKTVSFVGIYVHARRLYILEARVPPDTPGAIHFQQSLFILDEEGKRIRYELDADGNRVRRVTDLDGVC